MVFDGVFQGGGEVAAGNVNGVGRDEIVIAGAAGKPTVQVYKYDGALRSEFFPYEEEMPYGIHVAVGDLDKDGKAEIITGAGKGGGAHVRVFDGEGNPKKYNPGFFAYSDDFRGGVYVAVGDLEGDGWGEIITGAGEGGQSHVRVFDRKGNSTGQDFWPFESSYLGGVTVAVGNIDGGMDEELIFGKSLFGAPQVKVYKANPEKTILGDFFAWDKSFYGGVNVASGNIDNDTKDEVVVSVHSRGGPQVRFFESNGAEIFTNFFAYETDFRGGVDIALGNIYGKSRYDEIITLPGKKVMQSSRQDLYKYIEVDISEQKIYAYEDGLLAISSLTSTGVPGFDTPEGEFVVQSKIPSTRMTGFYGPDDPLNYDLADVPDVLPFQGDYTIHGAYWHNNFGRKMSHGCINLPLDFAQKLYDWSNVGDVVWIHE